MSEQKERVLYKALLEGSAMEGWSLFRLADGSYGKKPADCAGIAPTGQGVLLEVKYTDKEHSTIPWNLFSTHQKIWAQEFANQGGIALAAIYSDTTGTMTVFKLRKGYNEQDECEVFKLIRNKFGLYSGWDQLLAQAVGV